MALPVAGQGAYSRHIERPLIVSFEDLRIITTKCLLLIRYFRSMEYHKDIITSPLYTVLM